MKIFQILVYIYVKKKTQYILYVRPSQAIIATMGKHVKY
jgi:hypothetical protein